MPPETSEPILRSRLDALEENLDRIEDPATIRKAFNLDHTKEYGTGFGKHFDREFWDQFQLRLTAQVGQKLEGVQGIRKLLDRLDEAEATSDPASRARILVDAWAEYRTVREQLSFDTLDETGDAQTPVAKAVKALETPGDSQSPTAKAVALQIAWGDYLVLREQCQEIFLEFHDVIAGLVYREKNFEVEEGRTFDPMIFNAADELVTQCAKGSLMSPSLTVPSPYEALARTLGRIVRMRYSEWTVWSLPLIAHEFAHVVLSDPNYSGIAKIFDEKSLRDRLAGLDPEMRDALNPGADESTKRKVHGLARKRVENELRYHLADAWGTWVIGPAYAYAAIHQRLNPTHVSALDTVDSFDHERAAVIFGVLEKMGQRDYARERSLTPEEFQKLVGDLRKVWDDMVKRANPPDTVDSTLPAQRVQNRTDCLKDIVELVCRRFRAEPFFKILLYTRAGGATPEGWEGASSWFRQWDDDLRRGASRPLRRIEVSGSSHIRDALNAGWRCRMAWPSEVKRIEDALRQLCRDIFLWRLRDAGGGYAGPNR
jgi:hypothetical protein